MPEQSAEPNSPDTGEIRNLSVEECWELADAATVGRIAFVADDGGVQIIPVNYLVNDGIVIRTRSGGIVAGQEGRRVTFQVDYHGADGVGWSVLMQGVLEPADEDLADRVGNLDRVQPWAGGHRSHLVHLRPTTITGRRVRRTRNR